MSMLNGSSIVLRVLTVAPCAHSEDTMHDLFCKHTFLDYDCLLLDMLTVPRLRKRKHIHATVEIVMMLQKILM